MPARELVNLNIYAAVRKNLVALINKASGIETNSRKAWGNPRSLESSQKTKAKAKARYLRFRLWRIAARGSE